jgi:hypothetical protein
VQASGDEPVKNHVVYVIQNGILSGIANINELVDESGKFLNEDGFFFKQ